MTHKELLTLHLDICNEAHELMIKKNNDYAGPNEPFRNFELANQLNICSVEQAFLVRLTDKLSRIITAVNGTELQVKDESFRDTVIDAINYLVLLYAYIQSKKEPHKYPVPPEVEKAMMEQFSHLDSNKFHT